MTAPPVNDLVVVIPGIQGSRLARDGTPIWDVSAGAFWRGLTTLGASIKSLELPPDIGDDDAPDGVEPVGLMPDLHGLPGLGPIVRGYTGLVEWLKRDVGLRAATPASPGNLVDFPYDWRLSNRNSAKRLAETVTRELSRWRRDGHRDAKIVLLAHSMGGLVARYYLEVLGGAEVARSLVTFGTPHRGAANAVINLVNGVRVGFGPVKIDVSALGRSLPSAYQLLPTYQCVNTPTGRVDLQTAGLSRLDAARVLDGVAFHQEITDAANRNGSTYGFRAVVGTRQPTWATVTPRDDRVEPVATVDEDDQRGDGTVPRFASIPLEMPPDDLRQLNSAQTHGWLHLHQSVLDDLHGILTARRVVYMDRARDMDRQVGIAVPELIAPSAPIDVYATSEDDRLLLHAELRDDRGAVMRSAALQNLDGGIYRATFEPVSDGVYVVVVGGRRGSGLDEVATGVVVANHDVEGVDA